MTEAQASKVSAVVGALVAAGFEDAAAHEPQGMVRDVVVAPVPSARRAILTIDRNGEIDRTMLGCLGVHRGGVEAALKAAGLL